MKYEGKLSTDVLSDIEDRVYRVQNCLRTSTSAWLEVAREFADAKTKLKSIAFERFVNEVGVTKSIADKLVIVGRRSVLFDEKSSTTSRLPKDGRSCMSLPSSMTRKSLKLSRW